MSTLALDFGGTRIKAGIVCDGVVKDSFVLSVPENVSLEQQLPMLKALYLGLPAELRKDVNAMACALPCIVDPAAAKVVRVFGKYDDSLDFPLSEWAEKELGLPVIIENDARAAAVGEWKCGAGKGFEDLVTVTLGTGIGTAVISGGKPLYGTSGVAGNLGGHNIIYPGGRQCVCGLRGCVEAYVGTWAMPDIVRESPIFESSSLSENSLIDYLAVFEQSKEGDALAITVRDRALQYWATLLINITQQYDPAAIILGGGIMAGKADIMPMLHYHLDQQLHETQHKPKLLSAVLGDDAALVGLDRLWNIKSSAN